MNCLVFLCAMVVAVSAQFRYRQPLLSLGGGGSDEYAASLGGAPVGLYGRSSALGVSEVHSASLAGAKVGVYGKDGGARPRILKRPIPIIRRPVLPIPIIKRPIRLPLLRRRLYGLYPYGPHVSISAARSIADAFNRRTLSKSFGYEGTYLPGRYGGYRG